jgi:hypothetical protein
MPSLWTLQEFDEAEPVRASHLRQAPPWEELIRAVGDAFRTALETKRARFGIDESGPNFQDHRGIVQFQLGKALFDWFFNGLTGYRAQFRIGCANGLAMNAQLIRELVGELEHFATTDVVIHRYTNEFIYKQSTPGKVSQVATTFHPPLAKVWLCEKLIGNAGQVEMLFVSRTGPKLLMADTEPWSSFYPEDADGWLDVKGAFVPPSGVPYQLKLPEVRAATLEERGSA